MPRPTQKPRPKFYVAALNTPNSFAFAGRMGYSVMAIPLGGGAMRALIGAYREAWKAAGHPGDGEIMLAFHMFCDADGERARDFAARFSTTIFSRWSRPLPIGSTAAPRRIIPVTTR